MDKGSIRYLAGFNGVFADHLAVIILAMGFCSPAVEWPSYAVGHYVEAHWYCVGFSLFRIEI